jgi:hypothetical protein
MGKSRWTGSSVMTEKEAREVLKVLEPLYNFALTYAHESSIKQASSSLFPHVENLIEEMAVASGRRPLYGR